MQQEQSLVGNYKAYKLLERLFDRSTGAPVVIRSLLLQKAMVLRSRVVYHKKTFVVCNIIFFCFCRAITTAFALAICGGKKSNGKG